MNESVDIKKIKAKARKSLSGKYFDVVIAVLIYGLLCFMCVATAKFIKEPPMMIFLNLIITSLFYMGLLQIMVKIARNKKTSFNELFQRTDSFFRCAAITVVFIAINTICALLEYTAINSLIVFISYQTDLNVALSSFMIVIGIILSAAIFVFWIVLMLCLSQSYFILYDNEDMQLGDIFRTSMDMMEGHKTDYIMLCLSFLGWVILGLFTFGILYLWLIPYIFVSQVNFYDKIKKDVKILDA